MVFSVLVVILVTVWQASAQAPGDEDNHCLNEHAQANDVYQPLTKTLMDSRNYEELISSLLPHWQQLDVCIESITPPPLPVRGKHKPYTFFGCNTYSIPTINLYSVIKRFRNTLRLVQFSKQDTLCVHFKNEPTDHVWQSLKTQGRNCNLRKFCAFGSCSWTCS